MKVRILDIPFEIDDHAEGPAVFYLGVRKSGSTMFNHIGFMLSRMNKKNFVNVAGTFFQHNIDVPQWFAAEDLVKLLKPGNVYGGFRNSPDPFVNTEIYTGAKKLLMYRDPRDALVSEYFSTAYSHSLPQGSENATGGARAMLVEERKQARHTSIDEYVVRRARAMARTMLPFSALLNDSSAICFKYEDVIYKKSEMLSQIVTYLNWNCSPTQAAQILEKVDLRPVAEDPRAFVRRVTPGDHREKLLKSTIQHLNRELAPVLNTFGYETQ